MPDFKQTFQEEVRRLARKELKALDEKINEQKKTINALLKRIGELEKKQAAPAAVTAAPGKPADAPAQDAKGRKARFSPKSIVKFRKKYAISQKALAKLLDVTPFTVSHWEIGKNRPRPVQIEAFSALTKLLLRKRPPANVPRRKRKLPRRRTPPLPPSADARPPRRRLPQKRLPLRRRRLPLRRLLLRRQMPSDLFADFDSSRRARFGSVFFCRK